MKRFLRALPELLAVVLFASWGAGCGSVTTLTVLTDAPPGRVAEIHGGTVDLSRGVAVALECYFQDRDDNLLEDKSGACRDFRVTVETPGMADVLPAHLDGVASPSGGGSAGVQVDAQGRDRAVVVIVGKATGSTRLQIHHEEDDRTFDLRVVDGSQGR